MPNSRDVISILIFIFCQHAVNAAEEDLLLRLLDTYFENTRLLHSSLHSSLYAFSLSSWPFKDDFFSPSLALPKNVEEAWSKIKCRYNSLKDQNADFQRDLNNLEMKLEAKKTELAHLLHLEKKLSLKEYAISEDLSKQNVALSRDLKKLEMKLEAKKTELAHLEKKLNLKDAISEDLNKQNVALNKNLAATEEQNVALNKNLTATEEQNVALNKNLAATEEQNVALNKKLTATEKQNVALDKNLTATEERLYIMTTTLGENEEKVRNMNKTLGENVAEIGKLKHYKVALEDFLKNLTTARDMTVEAMKAEISCFTTRLAQKEAKVETMNQTLSERQADVKTLTVIIVLLLLLFYVFLVPCIRSRFSKDIR